MFRLATLRVVSESKFDLVGSLGVNNIVNWDKNWDKTGSFDQISFIFLL